MQNWQEDHLNALLTEHEEVALFAKVSELAQRLGFEHCTFGIKAPWPLNQPRFHMLSTYPTDWQQRYVARQYINIDPTVLHCATSTEPIVWSEPLFRQARVLWEEARSYGLRVGWAKSSRDMQGNTSMLVMARSAEPLSELELRDKEMAMHWLSNVAQIGLSALIGPKLPEVEKIELTDRERAILRWTADGKTSAEIARILRVSERTVNFHVHNLMDKFSVVNKTAAAVKAALLGLI